MPQLCGHDQDRGQDAQAQQTRRAIIRVVMMNNALARTRRLHLGHVEHRTAATTAEVHSPALHFRIMVAAMNPNPGTSISSAVFGHPHSKTTRATPKIA